MTGPRARGDAESSGGGAPSMINPPRPSRAAGGPRWSSLSLGVLTAIGGFVDMNGIITAAQAGAQYRFALLWTLVPGVVGLIVYADMAGRVAIASGRTLFDVIRDRLGFKLALLPLIATAIVNLLTLVIELAGMSLALELASQISYLLWFPIAAIILGVILWRASFDVLENGSAFLGLTMLVAVVAMFKLDPPWGTIAHDVVLPPVSGVNSLPGYLFAAIGLLGAYMTPYQFYFYSSGAIEDEWDGKDLLINRVTAVLGSFLGAGVDFALVVVAALVLFPLHAQVNTLADAGRPVAASLGTIGWVLFIVGAFSVSMGAGLETALSGAYAFCQYFGWDWGKKGCPARTPVFHLGYLVMLALSLLVAYTGVDPIQLSLVTMAVAAATLPFTFAPLLIVANDRLYMGEQKNTPMVNFVSYVILALLVVVTLASIPLLIITGGGG
jgi:Mn2+/Fe2+ NRAMP family transporter